MSLVLRGPGGVELPLTLLELDGRTARFTTDAEGWETVRAAALLHTDRAVDAGADRPFEPDRPVEVEAVLDPQVHLDDAEAMADAHRWWAIAATQAVDLPPELEGEGELREGLSFGPAPWEALEDAWAIASGNEPLLDLVIDVLAGQGWEVERPEPDTTIVQVPLPDDLAGIDLWVRTVEDDELVTVFSVVREDVPEDRVGDVLELAARLNEGVAVGSYEADADSGLLSFKVGIDVEGDRLSAALVRQMVGTALVAAQRARPLLVGFLAGEHSARGAASLL